MLNLLPALAAMLRGEGPAWLPVPADQPDEIAALASALDAGAPLTKAEDDPADPTALVIGTSGSTGPPKGALLPVAALVASADATRCFLNCRDGSHPHRDPFAARRRTTAPGTWLLALPAHHIAGLQVVLRALAEGTEPVVLDTGIPFTATTFVASVARMPAGRRFTSLVPTQLHRVLADEEATAALGTFDAVLVGGAATPEVLLDRVRRAGVRAVTTYGMSETCGGCVYDGVPLELVSVSIDSPEVGVPGQVSITGPMVAAGYRGLPQHPAFLPPTVSGTFGTRHRTFVTNDLAVPDGPRIRITGRADDVIVSGGVKIDPLLVEAVLGRVTGIAEVVITSVPDQEWGQAIVAVVVPDFGTGGPELSTLRAAAVYAHGPAAAPKHLLLVDQLPFRGIGKPDRRLIAELARQRLTGG